VAMQVSGARVAVRQVAAQDVVEGCAIEPLEHSYP
jgi:hypothetical protein